MNEQAVIASFFLYVNIGIFLLVLLPMLRRTRVDECKEELFTVRDGLFDLMLSKKADFNDPAYVMVRRHLNSIILWSHRITLLRTVWFFLEAKRASESGVFNEESTDTVLGRVEDLHVRRPLEAAMRKSSEIVLRLAFPFGTHHVMRFAHELSCKLEAVLTHALVSSPPPTEPPSRGGLDLLRFMRAA